MPPGGDAGIEHGLELDAGLANQGVRRWLDEERAVMLPAPAVQAPESARQRAALPVESLQHPLAVYDAPLESV